MQLLVLTLNNELAQQHKLWALTNTFGNASLIAALVCIICKKNYRGLVAVFCVGCVASINLALANTLFSVHPVMLGAGLAALAIKARLKPANSWAYVAMSAAAIFLGGFWSAQELNWGGWWNWDVLELSSLGAWMSLTYVKHIKGARRARSVAWCCAVVTMTGLYALNKSGIGVSIHSFITSGMLRTNYCLILTLFCFSLQGLIRQAYIISFCWLSLYVTLVSAYALKPLCLLTLCPLGPRNGWCALLHKVVKAVCIFFVAINLCNTALTAVSVASTQFYNHSFAQIATLAEQRGTQLWHTAWRSKPIISYGYSAFIPQKRAPFLLLKGIAFNK